MRKMILLVGFLLCGNVSADYTPKYGIHADGFPLIEGFTGISDFVDHCADKGYSTIMFNVIPGDDILYSDCCCFVSPTLNSLGWGFRGDSLMVLLNCAYPQGIEVFADIQTLAWRIRFDTLMNWQGQPPTTDDVVSVVQGLIAYGVDGIDDELFLAQWFEPVYEVCQNGGITYLHKTVSGDPQFACEDSGLTIFETLTNCNIGMTEDYYINWSLASDQKFPAILRGLGKEYWMKTGPDYYPEIPNTVPSVGSMENVMLLRAFQFNPPYIFAVIYKRESFDEFNPLRVDSLIKRYVKQENKPLCNVIYYLTGEAGTESSPKDLWCWEQLEPGFDGIANGISAAGYDMVITPTPIDTADMYYIYTRGGWWNELNVLNLPDSIMSLFDSGKPVFLQVGGILPGSTPEWLSVREKLGIDSSLFDILYGDSRPVNGVYNGVEYQHSDTFWGGCVATGIKPENITDGEVLSTGVAQSDTYALIVKKGNNYFINSGGLGIEASFPISNIISNTLQEPNKIIAITGSTSMFYAIDTTALQIKLPDSSITQLTWTKRDIDGIETSGEAPYDSALGYTDTLLRGTLLILEPKGTGIEDRNGTIISNFELHPIFPNPFNSSTSIKYSVAKTGHVKLNIYNVAGQLVRTLVDEQKKVGIHTVHWDGKDPKGKPLPNGIYFCQLRSENKVETRKVTILR